MSHAPVLYSASTIARLFNLTERRVQQLASDKIIPKPQRGKYELVGAVRGYVQYLKARASGQQGGASEYQTQRLRLIKAQADEAQLRVAELRAERVSMDEVAQAWERFSGAMIVRFMLLPNYLQDEFGLTDDERGVIEVELHTVLENLTQPFDQFLRSVHAP